MEPIDAMAGEGHAVSCLHCGRGRLSWRLNLYARIGAAAYRAAERIDDWLAGLASKELANRQLRPRRCWRRFWGGCRWRG